MQKILALFALAVFAAAPALAWEHWGGDRGGMRFSPLTRITPANVGDLVRAFDARTGRPRWSFDPLIHAGIVAGHANVWGRRCRWTKSMDWYSC